MNNNYYDILGEQYIRVTAVIGELINKAPVLMPWAVKLCGQYLKWKFPLGQGMELPPGKSLAVVIHDAVDEAVNKWREFSKDAMDKGSIVHDLIEKYIKEGKDAMGELPDQAQNAFLAFLEWESKNKVIWHESELTVYHPGLCYAGTLDAICTINGRRFLVDFKTSSGIYDDYKLQIAAYRLALFEIRPDVEIHGMGILRLDKNTGMPEWKEIKDYERYAECWELMVNLWYKLKKRKIKNKRTR